MKKVFLSIPLFIGLFFFSAGPAWGQNKAGINIGDHWQEFDQAARIVGAGGWIVVMACPGDGDKIAENIAKHPKINLVIRGHYPGTTPNAALAKAWAATLGAIPTPNKIYFMPWNEPNQEGAADYGEPSAVIQYIGDLRTAFGSLLGNKVILLSPMMNPSNPSFPGYIEKLGGSFFGQFEGIALSLYDTCNGCGNKYNDPMKSPELLVEMGVSGKAIFGVESGTAGPFFYFTQPPDSGSYLYRFVNNFIKNSPGAVRMFAIPSYDLAGERGHAWSLYSPSVVTGLLAGAENGGTTPAGGGSFTTSLNKCPGKNYTFYAQNEGECTECGGGSSLLVCKPIPADNFGEEYSKEALKLVETVHREAAPTGTAGEYCATKQFTGDVSAENASLPLVHDLNLYYLGPYVDNLQARAAKTDLDPIKDFGVFEKLAPKALQDELKIKFLAQVSRGGSRYQNFKVNGVPAAAITQRFLEIKEKSSALSKTDLNFLKEIWAQVPLFANEESEGEIVLEGAGITGSIKTSVPEVYRLNQVTALIAKMIGAGSPKALAEKTEKAPLADAAVLGEKTSGPVLAACDMGDGPPNISSKETANGAESGICTSEDIQVKKTENLNGVRAFSDSVFGGQDVGGCDEKTVNACCGNGGKCLPNNASSPGNLCSSGSCHCQTCSGGDFCYYDGGNYSGCKIKESSHNFDTNISIKNRVPYLKAVADNSVEENSIYRLFLPSPNSQESVLQQTFSSVFRDVAGESQATIDLKNFQQKIPQIEVSPSASSNPVTLLFYKLGTLVNAKKFISGVVLWPGGQASASFNPPSAPTTLGYTIDFRNPNIQVTRKEEVIQMVLGSWPASKIKTQWDYVYRQAVDHGWNPALVIALWIEESGASGVTFRQDLNREVFDLGCLAGKPNNLASQLDCLFHKALNTGGSFGAFMCSYSENKPAGCEFEANPNFPINLKIWYDRLTQ